MKKLIAGLLVFLGAATAGAQVSQEPVTVQNFTPSGACITAPLIKVTNVGTYQCVGSAWTLIGPNVGGGVASVFGRTGSVDAQTGDYSASQIGGLGSAATVDIGTTGSTVPLLSLGNTWAGIQRFIPGLATNAINNLASGNNAAIGLPLTGATISRFITDANAALTVTQTSALSTGDIADFANNTGVVASISQSGTMAAPTVNATAAYQRSGAAVQTVVSGFFITKAVNSESFVLAGVKVGSGCAFSPQNAGAAAHLSATYWAGTGVDAVSFVHDPTGGDSYFVICTVQ